MVTGMILDLLMMNFPNGKSTRESAGNWRQFLEIPGSQIQDQLGPASWCERWFTTLWTEGIYRAHHGKKNPHKPRDVSQVMCVNLKQSFWDLKLQVNRWVDGDDNTPSGPSSMVLTIYRLTGTFTRHHLALILADISEAFSAPWLRRCDHIHHQGSWWPLCHPNTCLNGGDMTKWECESPVYGKQIPGLVDMSPFLAALSHLKWSSYVTLPFLRH